MHLTRRKFLWTGATIPYAWKAIAQSMTSEHWLLIGTDNGKGIYRARWNGDTGELGPIELSVPTSRPSFLAQHPRKPVVYAVNALGKGKGSVSSFHLDAASANLTALNSATSHGDGPCFVSASATRAYVANYSGGSFAAYSLAADGSLVDDLGSYDCKQPLEACGKLGPVSDRQDASHFHCVTIAPDGRIVVCNLGTDSILVCDEPGTSVQPPQRFSSRAGSGPRHVAFHPNGRWMYCIHELDCTIDQWDWHNGKLTPHDGSAISTLAPNAPKTGNTACELIVSPDGRFAYACTRGVDDIVSYTIDQTTGRLTEQQRFSCGGKTPRYMAFDPTHRWLVVCNQAVPGIITVFSHDPATGRFHTTPKTFAAGTPMFVLWV